MEVTNAHAQQALHSSLMEKPVIMVRFSEVGGGGGCRREGSNKYVVYLDHRYTKKVRAGRYWSIAPPLESKKIP